MQLSKASCCLVMGAVVTFGQNSIAVVPRQLQISASLMGDAGSVASVFITQMGNPEGRVKFRLESVTTTLSAPNFLVVSPTSGTTPAQVYIGPNLNVTRTIPPRRYGALLRFVTVDESPERGDGASVSFESGAATLERRSSLLGIAVADPAGCGIPSKHRSRQRGRWRGV